MRFRLSDTAKLLLSLYVPSMIMSFGQGMVVPTIPVLARTFDVSVGLAAQAVTAQLLGRTLALLPVGLCIDRLGRRPVLLAGPALMAAASALTAIAPAFWMLLAAQFLTGVGSSMWSTAREIAAVDVVRADQRGRMMSGFMGMSSVGVAFGPVLGGVVSTLLGFRAVFWVYAVMGLITLAVSVRIRETSRRQPAAHGRLLNLGSVREVEPEFRPTFVVLIINTFVAMMRGALINSILPLYIGVQLGYSSVEVGAVFGLYGLVNVLMIGPTGFLSDSVGRKWVVAPSTYLATAAFLLFPLSQQMWQLSALGGVLGVATGLALGTMATYSYDIIPEQARGRLQALRRLIGESGGIVGPLVAGVIADAAGPATVFWCFVPLQLVSGLLITFVARESLPRLRAPRADVPGAPS